MVRLGRTISIEDAVEFVEGQRKRGSRLLKPLARAIPNIEALFKTNLGNELLKDDLDQFDFLLCKIIDEEATPEERAEFRVIRRRLSIIAERLSTFMEGLKQMRTGGKNE